MHITSAQNPRVKSILRLKSDSQERRREGLLLVEGVDEIQLALEAGQAPRVLISAPDLARRAIPFPEGEQFTVTEAIFRKLSVRENPDGWLAVFARPEARLPDLKLRQDPLLLLLEAVEKPGNLGAMLRTADAARVDGVIVCDPRADVFGPNVVRASRGALFAVPVVEERGEAAIAFFKESRIRIVAANPNAGVDYDRADLRGGIAVAMGTEDAGLSRTWLAAADQHVRIPMHGKVNSLNVSVAAALLLYEALRQRSQ